MKRRIGKINKKVTKLQKEKKAIQESCKHKDIVYTYYGSTGNYDPSDDGFTFWYKCKSCEKGAFIDDRDTAFDFRASRNSTYKEDL